MCLYNLNNTSKNHSSFNFDYISMLAKSSEPFLLLFESFISLGIIDCDFAISKEIAVWFSILTEDEYGAELLVGRLFVFDSVLEGELLEVSRGSAEGVAH